MNRLIGSPWARATTFTAATRASASAACAVPGTYMPVVGSLNSTTSPTAKTPGNPGTSSVGSTAIRPPLPCATGSARIAGGASRPALQTAMSHARTLPSSRKTRLGSTRVTLSPWIIVTPDLREDLTRVGDQMRQEPREEGERIRSAE